ncbi:MAG: TIGR02300 family protein [Alphaproteobacteria bacterium]
MSTASSPMGLKRICTGCGARFFDMNKRPIVCPTCNTEFTGEIKMKSRRGRATAEAPPKKEVKAVETVESDDDVTEEDTGVEVVSLDDAEAVEKGDSEAPALEEDENLENIPDFDDELEEELDVEDDVLLDEEDT